MSQGKLETPPVGLEPCATKCPICTGAWYHEKRWHNIFLKVDKAEVVQFLECEPLQKQMGQLVASRDNILDILWRQEKWRMDKIFRDKVKKSNVDALFLLGSYN